MTNRIVEISETSARLRLENGLLFIELPSGQRTIIPLKELQCIIVANPAVTISGALLAGIASSNIVFVVSDEKRMPVAMQLPVVGNYDQTGRFMAQAEASLPLRKQLWKTVVKAKIRRQANTLQFFHGNDFGLERLCECVRSGDPENMEAQAARIYWQRLFSVPFTRNRDAEDNNLLLNYGYAVLRAMTARACCGAGLHPTIGINHHNEYNAFCLADDLMEPFRPVVDRCVFNLNPCNIEMPLSQEIRHSLISCLLQKVVTKDGKWTVADVLRLSAEQLVKSFIVKENLLKYDWDFQDDNIGDESNVASGNV